MSAGISQKRATSIMRRAIRKIEAELTKAGVLHHYANQTLYNGASVAHEEPSLPPKPGPSFEISYSHGHMSNGESVISPLMFVHLEAGARPKVYGWMDFEKGMALIKSLFGVRSIAQESA